MLATRFVDYARLSSRFHNDLSDKANTTEVGDCKYLKFLSRLTKHSQSSSHAVRTISDQSLTPKKKGNSATRKIEPPHTHLDVNSKRFIQSKVHIKVWETRQSTQNPGTTNQFHLKNCTQEALMNKNFQNRGCERQTSIRVLTCLPMTPQGDPISSTL